MAFFREIRDFIPSFLAVIIMFGSYSYSTCYIIALIIILVTDLCTTYKATSRKCAG